MKFFTTLTEIYPLVAGLTSMLVGQLLKILFTYLNQGKVSLRKFSSSGGMPSSHAAMVTGLSTAIGLQDGWTSSTFCICVILSLVILYDAAGVRRAAGKQAAILNQMVEDLFERGDFKVERLSELIGHTPSEVLVGALLGAGIAFTLYY